MGGEWEIGTTGTPGQVRAMIRHGGWRKPTAGLAPGYVQAKLVVLPRELAYDFLRFAQRNPRPCPVIEVTDTGSPDPGSRRLARISGPTSPSTGSTGTASLTGR
jgi:uncharacterized protein YcsI (UPF0317 family)